MAIVIQFGDKMRAVESVYAGPINSNGQAQTIYQVNQPENAKFAKGLMVFERGSGLYLGGWSGGRYHGLGKYVSADDGARYEGGWINGLMHGHGKFTWPVVKTKGKDVQLTFIGEFREDRRIRGKIYDEEYNLIQEYDHEEQEHQQKSAKKQK